MPSNDGGFGCLAALFGIYHGQMAQVIEADYLVLGSGIAGLSFALQAAESGQVLIATKVGKGADHPGLSAPAIRAAVEASLRRLRVEHIEQESLELMDVLLASVVVLER